MKETAAFIGASGLVYCELYVILRYRCLDVLWCPVGRLVRFVFVEHPHRGPIFLLATDTLAKTFLSLSSERRNIHSFRFQPHNRPFYWTIDL
jgi:hypothetical protein